MKLFISLTIAALTLTLTGCTENSEDTACYDMGYAKDQAAIAAVGEWPEDEKKIACIAAIAAGEKAQQAE